MIMECIYVGEIMSEESPVDEYIEKTEQIIKELKEKKAGDRLDLISVIEQCITALNASTLGWNAWLQHPSIMKVFNETEITEITEGIRKMSSEFLEFDIKWTKILKERKEAEIVAKHKKKEAEKQTSKNGGKQYIS
jgi:hypothetical protein